MKKITLAIVTFVLALVALVAPVKTTKVEAANIPAETTLYLKPNSNWKSSGARFAAYFFVKNGSSKWVSMELVAGETDIYKATAPSGASWTNVIFCRMNGGNSTNDWNNKWNQTGDLTWNGTNNLCAINDGQWDCGTNVKWSSYTEPSNPVYGNLVLGVIGSFASSNWNSDIDMAYNEEAERYELEMTFAVDDQWKVRKDNAWTESYGYANADASAKQYTKSSSDGNLQVTVAGKYLVWIDNNMHIGMELLVEPWELEVKVGYQVGTKDDTKALRLVAELNLDAEKLESFDSTIQFRVTKGTKADTRDVTRLYSSVNPMNGEAVLEGAYYAVLTYTNIPAGTYTVEVLVDGVVAATVTATVA